MGDLRKTRVRRRLSHALSGMPAVPVDLLADLDHVVREARARGVEDAEGGLHDVGADAVAVGDRDLAGSAHVRKRVRLTPSR